MPNTSLDRWIVRIVALDGPLHEDELLRAIRDDLGYKRTGHILEAQWRHTIKGAVNAGKIVRREAWLWPADMDVRQPPVRVNVGRVRRPIEMYPDEELWRAMQIAVTVASSLPLADVPAETARLLAMKLTAAVAEDLNFLVPLALQNGYLVQQGDSVRSG